MLSSNKRKLTNTVKRESAAIVYIHHR